MFTKGFPDEACYHLCYCDKVVQDEVKTLSNGFALLLSQDPDLEAKRKAELEKIRSEKRKFKARNQETLQRQQHEKLKKKLMKKKHVQKKKSEKVAK